MAKIFLSSFWFLFQNLTPAEMMGLMASFRQMCQPRYNLSDEIIDNVNAGQFPENNDLKVENCSFLKKHVFLCAFIRFSNLIG